MPLIRLNVNRETGRAQLHHSVQPADMFLNRTIARGAGPIIIMVHGYKYQPKVPRNCPQELIFANDHQQSWPRLLGLNGADSATGIAFGWCARGPMRHAFRQARETGRELARVIGILNRAAPHRPVHIIAHSMGGEVALSTLEHAPAGSVDRVILMAGASYQGHAQRALRSPCGQTAELFNIVSRENDIFDFFFERLIRPEMADDRPLGDGISAHNALTIQLDCQNTLATLDRLGAQIDRRRRPVCHWSTYTRPGAMQFYARLMEQPESLPLTLLKRQLPPPARRWSKPGRTLPDPAQSSSFSVP